MLGLLEKVKRLMYILIIKREICHMNDNSIEIAVEACSHYICH